MTGATESELERRVRRPADWLALGLLAVVLGWFLVTRYRTGLRFPVPWPDEGSFVWPAISFRDHGTLNAVELHPYREIYWMPPGFMLVAGLVLKVIPFSLDAVRTLSALYLVGAFACFGAAIWGLKARFGHIALLALFLHACPVVMVVGNVARMESMVLLAAAGGFALLTRGRAAGFGVLLLGPLAHPNGLFPLAGGALLWLVSPRSAFRWSRVDWAVIAFSILCWAGYTIKVLGAWDEFLTDMWAQLRFKALVSWSEGGFRKRITEGPFLFGLAVLGAALYPAWKLRIPVRQLSVLAAAFLGQTLVAAGWLYEVYAGMAALVASLVALEVSVVWASRKWPGARHVAHIVLAAAFVAGNFALVVRSEFVNRSLARATVVRQTLDPSYLTDSDYATVRGYLQANTPKEGKLVVQFVPDADALLYADLRGPHLSFVQQTFYESPFDVLIAHESVWFPKWIRELQMLKLFAMKGRQPRAQMIRFRNQTERWVVFDWRGLPRGTPVTPEAIHDMAAKGLLVAPGASASAGSAASGAPVASGTIAAPSGSAGGARAPSAAPGP